MSLQDMIQAFSRTNRIFDKDKTWGNVTYQYPKTFSEKIDDAIVLYSPNGGEKHAVAQSWEESKQSYGQPGLNDMYSFDADGSSSYAPKEEKKKFVVFQRIWQGFAAIKTCDEWYRRRAHVLGASDITIVDDCSHAWEFMRIILDDLRNDLWWRSHHNDDVGYEYELESFGQRKSMSA